jgi:hypothetical protein
MREICQSCTTDCYRDTGIMLHVSVSLGDSFARLREGKIGAALGLGRLAEPRLHPRHPLAVGPAGMKSSQPTVMSITINLSGLDEIKNQLQ